MTKRKKKPEPLLELADGRTGMRRFRTDIWHDFRLKDPDPWYGRGFPKMEEGSINTAMAIVGRGHAARVQCFDRVKGRVEWTVERGPRVPGTHVYQPIVTKGDV